MLIQFADVLKPYANLKRRHQGLVVKVDDPKNLGRIKVKIEGILECDDIARLPWVYPRESTTRGGRSDSAVTAVPPLYSIVTVEFPQFGDSPAVGGSIYYPVWSGMTRVGYSNPPIAGGNKTSEDGSLSMPYGAGASKAEDIETNVWVKTKSQNVAWIRVDKNLGSIEFFDQDSGATARFDRGGHLQLNVTSLDVNATEDVRFNVGKDFHVKAGADVFFDVSNNMMAKTGASFGVHAGNDITNHAGSAVETKAGTTVGIFSGTSAGIQAGTDIGLQAGTSIGAQASANVAMVAGASITESAGALCARDAALISDNGGAASGGASSPPGQIGTDGTLTSSLSSANSTLQSRFSALASLVSSLKGEASSTKSAGQSALNAIKTWAGRLTGKSI